MVLCFHLDEALELRRWLLEQPILISVGVVLPDEVLLFKKTSR